jgi:hypothetical protein
MFSGCLQGPFLSSFSRFENKDLESLHYPYFMDLTDKVDEVASNVGLGLNEFGGVITRTVEIKRMRRGSLSPDDWVNATNGSTSTILSSGQETQTKYR